ncbi:MAG TPA: hypothetical protein VF125_04425 [Solirubrobacterales bacterium]
MRVRPVLLAVVATLFALGASPVARATYDPLGSGTTVFRLDRGFLRVLHEHGVQLATREGAAFKAGILRFPVSGGKFDPRTREGTVEHGGVVLFQRGKRSISMKRLQLKTTRRSSPFVAKLAGGQLKVGAVNRLTVGRSGFANEVTVSSLRLSAKFAARLSKRLRLRDVFQEGMPVGSAVTKANPATVAILPKGGVQLGLDAGIAAKLNELHVAVNPIFPAERPNLFTLPTFSGKLALDFSSGFLQLQGGIEFIELGSGQVIWREPRVDLGEASFGPEVDVEPSPPFAGKAGLLTVAALDLAGGTTATNPAQRTLTVSGAPLILPESTAALFNEVFAKPQKKENVFSAGEILGRLSFVAEAQ